MNKRIIAILLVSACGAGEILGQAGQTGLSFLKIGVGGRALGMGEAYTAEGGDPASMHYNPASMSLSKTPQILLLHKEWIQGVRSEYLGAMTPVGQFRLGLSVNATSVDDIELRTVPGPPIGTFSARNAAMGISAAYDISPDLSIGLTGKYLYEKILVDEASGIGVDIGASYRRENLRLGAAMSNLGSMNSLADEATVLPRIFRAGAAYELALDQSGGSLIVSSDVVSITNESKTHVHVGAEYRYNTVFAVRAGYQSGYEARNISAGIGVRYGMLAVDYAFLPFRYDLGTTHTISLVIEFD